MARFTCERCGRHLKCKGPIGPIVTGNSVMIIGEQPGDEEELNGEPFWYTARCGKMVYSALKACHVENDHIITNTCCCYSTGKPTPKQIEACRTHWVGLVREHHPKVIISLGGPAACSVLRRKVKITEEVGQTIPVQIGKQTYPVVLSFHPSYILRQKDAGGGAAEKAEQAWIDAWETVDKLLHGESVEEPPDTRNIVNDSDIIKVLSWLLDDKEIVNITYDYETWGDKTALRPELCDVFYILSIGVAVQLKNQDIAFSFPFDHRSVACWKNPEIERLWRLVVEKGAIAQNAKYEHKCNIKRFGMTGPLRDTMLMSNVIDERQGARLEYIAHRCGIKWSHYKAAMHDVQVDPFTASIDKLLRYNGLDALCTLQSYKHLFDEIKQEKLQNTLKLAETYAEHLAYIEMTGYYIDTDTLQVVREHIDNDLKESTDRFRKHEAVRRSEEWASKNIKSWKKNPCFNPSSPPQMKHLCLDELKLNVKPDKYGDISLNKLVLERYVEREPVIRDLLNNRSLASMKSGFLDKWDDFTGPDNCVHTNYGQTDVVTGRLNSRDPNLQNIPKDSVIKSVFTSRWKGGVIICSDFNQLEPRILAGWSGDEGLCYALQNGFDLHLYVTASINELDYEECLQSLKVGDPKIKKLRDLGKRMNLGNMYGQTEYGLAQKANISETEAAKLLQMYDQRFPGVRALRDDFKKFALHHGYVVDLLGRRRHLPKVHSSNTAEANRALRQAGNAPIQSSGNQFCLMSLCICRTLLLQRGLKAVVMGPTHDSIDVDCHPDYVDSVRDTVKESMECHNGAFYWKDRKVDITAKVTMGPNLKDQT